MDRKFQKKSFDDYGKVNKICGCFRKIVKSYFFYGSSTVNKQEIDRKNKYKLLHNVQQLNIYT